MMEWIESAEEMRKARAEIRAEEKRVAWVPTQGFLHENHFFQMEEARKRADVVVLTRFVDPLEFGPNEDYDQYPRDRERDAEFCATAGVDIVFSPPASEVHLTEQSTAVEETRISRLLCGVGRPSHFRGVATTFVKFYHLLDPSAVCLSEHEWQRYAVLRRVARDLGFSAELAPARMAREKDGLAKDARNILLKPEQRKDAAAIYDALLNGKHLYDMGVRSVDRIRAEVINRLRETRRLHVQYATVVEQEEMIEVKEIIPGRTLICCAVLIDQIRLIDHVAI